MVARDLEHFRSIPWCAQILRNPAFTPIVTTSRRPKSAKRKHEDSFIAETLQTDRTIRHLLSLAKTASTDSNSSNPNDNTTTHPVPELWTLLDLGNGLNGYPAVLHGGCVATLLDEAIAILLAANVTAATRRRLDTDRGMNYFTANLTVNYRRPVPAPTVVVVKARIVRSAGRKVWVKAAVEDGRGTVYAEADALFVEPRQSKL